MSHKKDNDALATARQMDRLKWETAKKTGLQNGEFGAEITPEDVGVARMRDLVKSQEKALRQEEALKFDPEL